MGALTLLPGVVDTRNREAPGWGSVDNMSINGQTSFNFSYDGVTNKDTGSNSGNYAAPALDSIAEVKVQASNFQAEYGRSSGATIVVVTKSGSSRFTGSAAYFKRHEALNENTWSRRRACDAASLLGQTSTSCATPRYRYDNTAFTLGGPVLLPGTEFNSNRDKLFFFYSLDLLPRTDPLGLQNSTMPTALERMGDFSQTRNNAGTLRHIRDPLSGQACNVNTGGLLPRQCHPGRPDQFVRSGHVEPVPAAQCDRSDRWRTVQLPVRLSGRKAAARERCPSRLQRPSGDDLLQPRAVRQGNLPPWLRQPDRSVHAGKLAADAELLRHQHLQYR
jgi:hypothetical protein